MGTTDLAATSSETQEQETRPACTPGLTLAMRPKLIVTVDTEEEGLWKGSFPTRGNSVENTRGIVRFQALCQRFGVVPTYLVDTPVAEDDRSVGMLKELQNDGRCEVGAHLHPWCAPPLQEYVDQRDSYMCNLPETLQRQKLERLTDLIGRRFDKRPISFRAGRYGLDIVGARILQQLGYLVDSSVISFTDCSSDGGPDFRSFPYKPYRIDGESLHRAAPTGALLEVPVSVGFNWRNFSVAHRVRMLAAGRAFRPFHLIGVLDRLNLLRQVKFSPEQANAGRLKRLVDTFLANDAPCIVMLLHSSSLVPGFSPYARDWQGLNRLYQTLEVVFDYCVRQHRMDSETLSGFARNSQTTRTVG